MRCQIRSVCTIVELAFAFLFLVLPLAAAIFASPFGVFSALISSFVPCFVTALVLVFGLTAILVPALMFGKMVIGKIPFLRRQLGSIWMSGALIGICMFCLGVYYGMRH